MNDDMLRIVTAGNREMDARRDVMKRVWKPAVVIILAITIFRTCIPAFAAGAASATDFSVSNYQSFIETIARQYVQRDPTFTIRYTASLSEVQNSIKYNNRLWDDIFTVDLTGITSDLDYLHNNMSEMRISYTYSGTSAVCELTQTYLTSSAQEKYVNTAVAGALTALDIADSTAYGKIRAIYDYIIGLVEYDKTLSRFSAYDALYERSAVCQGYALLMYKMLMEAGIPARFISGEAVAGVRGPHAWNIVRIGQYWYNIDVTWDDSYDTSKYFLKSNASFSDHFRGSVFATAAFNAAHPMSPYDFSPAQDIKPVSGITLSPDEGAVYAVGDVFMLSAAVTPADASDKTLNWSSSDPGVATVDSTGRVTVTGPGMTVITAAAKDGTGKYADFTLTAHVSDTPNAWALSDISALNARGVIPPELNAGYRNIITRAEFIALIANVYEYAKGAGIPAGGTPFTDISVNPYQAQIAFCYQLGIIEGDGTLFRPDNALTREQCAKIISGMIGTINGTDISSSAVLPYADFWRISAWAVPYVRYAYETGLMVGANGCFSPQENLTREQAIMVAERMIEKFGW
jgi:hypothetical protein